MKKTQCSKPLLISFILMFWPFVFCAVVMALSQKWPDTENLALLNGPLVPIFTISFSLGLFLFFVALILKLFKIQLRQNKRTTMLLFALSFCFWSGSAKAQSFGQSQSTQYYPNGNIKAVQIMGVEEGEPYMQVFYEEQDGVLKAEWIYDSQRHVTVEKHYNLSGRLTSSKEIAVPELQKQRPRRDADPHKPYEPYVRQTRTLNPSKPDARGVSDQFRVSRTKPTRLFIPDEPVNYEDYLKEDCYDKDDLQACFRVGEFYESQRKITAARFWYKWACNEGNDDGCQQYDRITDSLWSEEEKMDQNKTVLDDSSYSEDFGWHEGVPVSQQPAPDLQSQDFRTQDIKCNEMQVGSSCYRLSQMIKNSNPGLSDYYLRLGCDYDNPASCQALDIPLKRTEAELIALRLEDDSYLLKKKDTRGRETFGAVLSPMQEKKMREESKKNLLDGSMRCLRGDTVYCQAAAHQFALREDYETASTLIARACDFTDISVCESWAEYELKLGNIYRHKKILQYLCAYGNYCRGIKKYGYEPLEVKPCRPLFRETKPEMLMYVAKKYKSGIPSNLVVQDVRPPVLILDRQQCEDYCEKEKQRQVKRNPVNIFSASCTFGGEDLLFYEYID